MFFFKKVHRNHQDIYWSSYGLSSMTKTITISSEVKCSKCGKFFLCRIPFLVFIFIESRIFSLCSYISFTFKTIFHLFGLSEAFLLASLTVIESNSFSNFHAFLALSYFKECSTSNFML